MFQLLQSNTTQSQESFSFPCCPASKGLGVHKEWEGDRNRIADLNWQRHVLYHVVSCGMIKKKRRKKGGSEPLGMMQFMFPRNHQAPRFPGSGISLLMESSSLALLCFSTWLLLYPVNCLYLNPGALALLPFHFFLIPLLAGSEQTCSAAGPTGPSHPQPPGQDGDLCPHGSV